jgi:Flp pilus assembly protein TadG
MQKTLPRPIGRRSGDKGQAIIEVALVAPLLLVLMMGVFDYSRAIHAQAVITNMSREAGNLISRSNQNLSGNESTDFQNVMNLVGQTAQPLNMTAQGMMYMYKVECVNNTNTITLEVDWNGSSLSTKPAMNASAAALGGITLAPGQVAYGVEVYYQYQSLFLGNQFTPTLASRSIF